MRGLLVLTVLAFTMPAFSGCIFPCRSVDDVHWLDDTSWEPAAEWNMTAYRGVRLPAAAANDDVAHLATAVWNIRLDGGESLRFRTGDAPDGGSMAEPRFTMSASTMLPWSTVEAYLDSYLDLMTVLLNETQNVDWRQRFDDLNPTSLSRFTSGEATGFLSAQFELPSTTDLSGIYLHVVESPGIVQEYYGADWGRIVTADGWDVMLGYVVRELPIEAHATLLVSSSGYVAVLDPPHGLDEKTELKQWAAEQAVENGLTRPAYDDMKLDVSDCDGGE